jgi:hypothetical protein
LIGCRFASRHYSGDRLPRPAGRSKCRPRTVRRAAERLHGHERPRVIMHPPNVMRWRVRGHLWSHRSPWQGCANVRRHQDRRKPSSTPPATG